eukprot:c28003_g1_i1.p1 GENE.c28003_g1_i1~~c28003_g1_i1.p1  ORF type:complete len:127 (-),score=4.59 c28003_g1_i1:25-405(-)
MEMNSHDSHAVSPLTKSGLSSNTNFAIFEIFQGPVLLAKRSTSLPLWAFTIPKFSKPNGCLFFRLWPIVHLRSRQPALSMSQEVVVLWFPSLEFDTRGRHAVVITESGYIEGRWQPQHGAVAVPYG